MRIEYLIEQLQEIAEYEGNVELFIYDPANSCPYPLTGFYMDSVKELGDLFYDSVCQSYIDSDLQDMKDNGYFDAKIVDHGKCLVLDSSYIQ